MVKAVFIASSHSQYFDRPGELYHFPNRNYLSRVLQTVGDWVVFYEGRRGDGRGYYSVQRVSRVEADPVAQDHSYAVLDRSSELSFENMVPRLRPDGTPYETGLAQMGGNNTSAVRLISDADFAAIVGEGLREAPVPDALPRVGSLSIPAAIPGFADPQSPFGPPREMVLSSRAFRDRAFARQVKRAYGARCAMSGLSLRNGGGRPEVEAAHIVPVEQRGPDTVWNGLALSGTLHWMFDRGLLSVDEDMTILAAKDSIATEVSERLLTPDRKLILPEDRRLQPHPAYFAWHRRECFKG